MIRINETEYLRLVRGESRGIPASLARLGLGAASGLYRLGVGARNLAFDRGWMASHRAQVPVVSVGNLTLGGTGKTPMVEWVARWYRTRGVRVAILSRGYGGEAGINDEGRVLEENLPDVPHLQAPDRLELAHKAVEELESELLVLDDGFQHRRLARDVDLVLLDALEPFGLGRISPRGLLREPVASLSRASLAVITRADLVDTSTRQAIRAKAEREAGPLRWVLARHAPLDLVDSAGSSSPLSLVQGLKVVAFCGIGNPDGFHKTLASLGLDVVEFRTFPDHHPYDRSDMAALTGLARTSNAELALTTQKDLVKLRTHSLGLVPLHALRIGLEIMEGVELLQGVLEPLVPSSKSGPTS